MRKFELSSEKKDGLFRIRSLIDIPGTSIRKGTMGGLVENESNLSHDGSCWIYDNARVFRNAVVKDDVKVFGYASIFDDAEVSGTGFVFSYAKVYGKTKISGNVWVAMESNVFGDCFISGDSKVYFNISSGTHTSIVVDNKTISYSGSDKNGLDYITIDSQYKQISKKNLSELFQKDF